MTDLIAEMLKEGLIKPKNSPYSSPVLLVKKKDGMWRFCVDYRALNSITIQDRSPILIIDELLDALHGESVADAVSRIEDPQVFTLSMPTFPWMQELRDYYLHNTEGKKLLDRYSTEPATLPGIFTWQNFGTTLATIVPLKWLLFKHYMADHHHRFPITHLEVRNSIDTTLREHQRLISLLKETLKRTRQRMTEQANKHRMEKELKVLVKSLGRDINESTWENQDEIQIPGAVDDLEDKGNNLKHLKIGLNDIKEATKNFDEAYSIGSGGFGKVYKADLEHFDSGNSSSIEGVDKCDLPRKRSTVAIKRINNQEGEQGFIAEIETLTTCKHENIISLLGFCYEGNGAMILVYEHASKGSLENYLGNSDKMTTLTWVQRVKICIDIAHGLNYIHNNTDDGKHKMIHRDIKSDNILLGDNWEGKIADFGLSKFHPVDQAASTIYTDMIAGTYVYLDPEYQKNGKLNKKSDIYSFGVVLLEILTGRLAYDSVYTKFDEKGIAPIARDHFEKGTIMEIVDHNIKEETDEYAFSLSKGPNKESLNIYLEIAFRCVAETQAQRPTIEVVIKELKKALNCQENHKDSLKLSLEDVTLATQNFDQDNIIGHGDSG
nr:protein kinase-like domain, phloem protein 2-like protein [Tanacetum cinerariifolium]